MSTVATRYRRETISDMYLALLRCRDALAEPDNRTLRQHAIEAATKALELEDCT